MHIPISNLDGRSRTMVAQHMHIIQDILYTYFCDEFGMSVGGGQGGRNFRMAMTDKSTTPPSGAHLPGYTFHQIHPQSFTE
eukprot:scaffold30331_cov35-Tisochrysis_lutea.AAC.2